MSAPQPLPRAAMLARLREPRMWDVVVIGGGATGLGCALDCAARGLSVALVEAGDFASGTSSRSTKLIHGGVRYLAQGNLALVREGLHERARLLRNAPPELAHPLGFVIPAYRLRDLVLYATGLKCYDLLAGASPLPSSRVLGAAAVRALAPGAAGRDPAGRPLRGGVLYYDGQFDDSRLAVSLMRTAVQHGAAALNYCRAEALLHGADGRIAGVEARDGETGERLTLRARGVINAAGVWCDAVRRMDDPRAAPLLTLSQGAHIVLDRDFLPGEHAILLPKTADGRVVFCLPWLGRTLVGTTDTPVAQAAQPLPLDEEIDFLLAAAGQVLLRRPGRADIRASFAGLRPLLAAQPGASTARLSREHAVLASASGLVTVAGGKWTTYRKMAADVVDRVCAVAGLAAPASATATLPLLAPLPSAGPRLHPDFPYTERQVRDAWRYEMARNADDVLARRTRLALLDAAAAESVRARVDALLAEERAAGG